MNTNKRVFVAAWEYPPIMSGESVVCQRTLENSAFDFDVCCGPADASGNKHIRLFPIDGNKYLNWPFAVAREFDKLNQKENYSVMMSRVMPPNGHLAGWLIKKRHPDVRWIAYFSDPVWNSPFIKFSLRQDGSHRPNWMLMKVFGFPCKWALKRADTLMFNNERLAHYILGSNYEKYCNKILIAPYGHEGVHPRPAPERGDGKFRLTHVGQIYGNRTFAALVEGLTLLKKQRPEIYAQLELRQVGFVCPAELRRVANSAVADVFTFVGQVPYDESIEEMYQSECLLTIDPVFDTPEKNIYIPGKLFDYLSTGRPIFCIAEENSATGDAAKILGCLRAAPVGADVLNAINSLLKSPIHIDPLLWQTASCRTGVIAVDHILASFCNCKGEIPKMKIRKHS